MLGPAPPPAQPGNVTAVILAAGLGRRMSSDGHGVDKGLVSFRGRSLVEHVIERIRPQVATMILNAESESVAWRQFGLPLCPDLVPGRLGPLAGVHAAMIRANTPWLLAVPCDTPQLPLDLLARFSNDQQKTGADRVSARCAGQSHPATMLVRTALAASLQRYLEAGGRKVESWLAEGTWTQVDFDDPCAFVNLNTPEELHDLESPQ